jgi:alpha-L-fucosidase 2
MREEGSAQIMKATRREFLQASTMASLAFFRQASATSPTEDSSSKVNRHKIDAFERASAHVFVRDKPGPTYFEGLLMGNGDVGVCAVVRPDALAFHISKSDCWDIRVSEESDKEVLPFSRILEMWKNASVELKTKGNSPSIEDAAFFREYCDRVGGSYRKEWPRPWGCGTIWLKWDSRWVEPKTYSLNPANGIFILDLKVRTFHDPERTARLTAFVDWDSGRLTIATDGPAPNLSVIYLPQIDGFHSSAFDSGHVEPRPDQLPMPELKHWVDESAGEFSCFQYFPVIRDSEGNPDPPRTERDRNFALHGRLAGTWSISQTESSKSLVFTTNADHALRLDVAVATPRDVLLSRLEAQSSASDDPSNWITIPQTHIYTDAELDTLAFTNRSVTDASKLAVDDLKRSSDARWREFWSASAVSVFDQELERIWYHNQYFLACCVRKHKNAPGLFANWSYGDIGSAWHSDYHLDYNCQQVYWGVFTSDHVDMHQPYVELIENLRPMSEKFSRDSFNLPGAFFPLSAYPVPSQIVPYPVPPWGYQICMTPWAVQSLWWQFLYTQDEKYLARVYPTMRSAARFLAAYLSKEDDGRYHIFPSVSSENWGFTVDFKFNKDCILDLSLSKFVLDAMVKASIILGKDPDERELWKEIGENLAPYPKAQGPFGEVWIDISNAPPEHVYNVPITLAPVFPGEQVGLDTGRKHLEIAIRTAQTIRLEGGNDLVSQPLIRARLGMLDLSWFKGQIEYCLLPDGVSNDRVRQIGGRYSLTTDFDFMMRMGLWCENFAVPAVLNECMLQSYTGTIRLFPNTLNLGPVSFENLRAVGAFLVSAAYDGEHVVRFEIFSEKGENLRFVNPWGQEQVRVTRLRDGRPIRALKQDNYWNAPTEAGESYSISAA